MLKSLFVIPIWLIITLMGPVVADYGLLLAAGNSSQTSLCFDYAKLDTEDLPRSAGAATFSPLLDLTWWDGCDGIPPHAMPDLQGRVVMVNSQQCSLYEKGFFIDVLGGVGVIVITPALSMKLLPKNGNGLYNGTITLSMIPEDSYKSIQELGSDVMVKFYVPKGRLYINFSMVAIWIMAIIGVVIGAIYTMDVRDKIRRCSNVIYQNESRYHLLVKGLSSQKSSRGRVIGPKATAICEICLAVLYLILLAGVMLLVYFFFGSMVYLFIALFCAASAVSVYWILQPFVHFVPCGSYSFAFHVPRLCNFTIEIRETILLAGCIALSATWCVLRHERFIWFLQDVLGMAVCITFLGVNRLETLKSCTLILVPFLIYDIFFVFITPLFTSDGKSVMERIVIGGDDEQVFSPHEQIPTILKVPYYTLDPLSICYQDSFFVLGFGDLMIPGLLVSLCYDFGIKTNSTKIYFPLVLIGYGLGLILTDTFLFVMRMAQPALLYLVPCTLTSAIVTSCIRKEFQYFWSGQQVFTDGYKYKKVNEMDCLESSELIVE